MKVTTKIKHHPHRVSERSYVTEEQTKPLINQQQKNPGVMNSFL